MDYRVIKEGELFLVTEKNGDLLHNDKGYGLYTRDTRFLSQMELNVNNEKLTLLSSEAETSDLSSIHLMRDVKDVGTLEVKRDRVIYDGVLYEKLTFKNYFLQPNAYSFSLTFDADFQDMYIVRGFRSGKVGRKTGFTIHDQCLKIRYEGADRLQRETQILWDMQSATVTQDGIVSAAIELGPQEETSVTFKIIPIMGHEQKKALSYEQAIVKLNDSYKKWNKTTTQMKTDLPIMQELFKRGSQDIKMLMTDIGFGDVPVAGLPWYAVPFGRDSIITALFMLSLSPETAKRTLRTLAAYQGEKVDEWRDEQPGKIMHEIRFGELSTTNQTPFTPYYGTNDATPLFLVLIAEYYHWTADLQLIKELEPHMMRALEWIDQYGDINETGFVSYHMNAEKGLPNQGWKDSSNSIIHKYGEYAASPISLIEIQGYVYHAKKELAPLFRQLGNETFAHQLTEDAKRLKESIDSSFWMDDEQYYALALDKNQGRIESVTSNVGHLLMSDLLDHDRAKQIGQRLTASDLFSGYGIRTMSTASTGYNPMSYHNGSVWPHDNAMCLFGLSRHGLKREVKIVLSGLLEAARRFEYQRLPELFCGHDHRVGYPVHYPATCSPQAWSAATSFIFLQAILGIKPNAVTKKLTVDPVFPEGMTYIVVEDMRIGAGELSLYIEHTDDSAYHVEVVNNTTGYQLIVPKLT